MNEERKKVSAVISAFNEEMTIESIVRSLLSSDYIQEIIVVDDGSTDSTHELLEEFKDKIKVVRLKNNNGKGHAMAVGVQEACGKIILFLDADIVDLTDENIASLLLPLVEQRYNGTTGYIVTYGMDYMLSDIGGQRAYYKKDLTPYLSELKEKRYGAEIFLNKIFKGKRIKKVKLNGVRHVNKYKKREFHIAVKEYIQEITDIAKEYSHHEDILSSDKKMLNKIRKLKDISEAKELAGKIKNNKIRRLLKRYLEN